MEKASTRLNVYMTQSERQAVREKARAEHCSQAYVIRMMIHTYLRREYEEILSREE